MASSAGQSSPRSAIAGFATSGRRKSRTPFASTAERVKAAANARQGGKTAAGALLNVYKVLLKYCVTVGWLEQSPAEQLTAKAVAGPRPASRSRVLSDDELRVVLTTDAAPGPVLRFLLATGLRITEAYEGYREGQYWVVPVAASKNKVAAPRLAQ